MKRKLKIILIMFICIFAYSLAVIKSINNIHKIKEMDREELHYDADDWFIMVDKEKGLIGIYDGTEPVFHLFCDTSNIPCDLTEIPILVIDR